jgi:hypothetical protein
MIVSRIDCIMKAIQSPPKFNPLLAAMAYLNACHWAEGPSGQGKPVTQSILSSRLHQVGLPVERRRVMPVRSGHDDDPSGGIMDRKVIVAGSRKQRLFHFIDWRTFVFTILTVERYGA